MPVKVPNDYFAPQGNTQQQSLPPPTMQPPPSMQTAYPPASSSSYQKQVGGPSIDAYGAPEHLSESFIAAISGFNFLELGEAPTGFGNEKKPDLMHWGVPDSFSDRSTSVDSGVNNSPGSAESIPSTSKDFATAEQVWAMPMAPKGYKSVPKESTPNELMSNRSGEPPRTTLMIRNIPRKYSQRQLLTDLNEAYAFTHGVDFFYLPTDLGTGRNLGYCFVNFLRPEDAEAVKQTLHKFRLFNAAKSGLSIGYADVQGFEQNLRNVRRSLMHRIKNREYRPLVAGPDGDLVPVTN
jgi:hypothetical protein